MSRYFQRRKDEKKKKTTSDYDIVRGTLLYTLYLLFVIDEL